MKNKPTRAGYFENNIDIKIRTNNPTTEIICSKELNDSIKTYKNTGIKINKIKIHLSCFLYGSFCNRLTKSTKIHSLK